MKTPLITKGRFRVQIEDRVTLDEVMARVAERYAAAEAHYGPAAPHLLAAQMTETANELIFSEQS